MQSINNKEWRKERINMEANVEHNKKVEVY